MDTRARNAVDDFGRMIGVPAQFDPQGRSSFEFSESGRLTFTESTDGRDLVVTLSFAVPSAARIAKLLLSNAGYDPASRMVLGVGAVDEGRVVLAVRRPQAGLNMQALAACFDFLKAKKRLIA